MGALYTGPGESDFTILCLSFLVCQMGRLTVPATQGYGKIRASVYGSLDLEDARNSPKISKSQTVVSSSRECVGPEQAQFGEWRFL